MHDCNPNPASQGGAAVPRTKRLGGYLVEAGLLTPAQVDVALNDQKSTGMRFGEVLAARGWVKQQTIEYFMQKVILPEQQSGSRRSPGASEKDRLPTKAIEAPTTASRNDVIAVETGRRDLPITKPLPSVSSGDDDVSWVG